MADLGQTYFHSDRTRRPLSLALQSLFSQVPVSRSFEGFLALSDPYRILPVIRFCGVLARTASSRDWAVEQLTKLWGPTYLRFPTLPFDGQAYYRDEMGEPLGQDFVAFDCPADPGGLADWKLETNRLEKIAAQAGLDDVLRPVNLDCGYISQDKFVLATMKNRAHRLYLRDNVFAEITLTFVGKTWRHHEQTYPNYRTVEVSRFAIRCRDRLREWIHAEVPHTGGNVALDGDANGGIE
jgi:hypothetical protein